MKIPPNFELPPITPVKAFTIELNCSHFLTREYVEAFEYEAKSHPLVNITNGEQLNNLFNIDFLKKEAKFLMFRKGLFKI